jgi:hypothetical protein
MFSISADFSIAEIEAYIKKETDVWFDELVDSFRVTGKGLVEKARAKTKSDGGFGNITWNLRSSIGYLIIYNGEMVETYFPTVGPGSEGSKTGTDYAREIGALINDHEGIQLVIVAGMEYATLVERVGVNGAAQRDVITHVVGDNIERALRSILI